MSDPPPSPIKSGAPDAVEEDRRGIILPTDSWKEQWDLWVLCLILYSAVMVPYRICFSDPATGSMFIFEQIVTATFITDVCMNFNTAFMDQDRWITDRGRIALHYMQGWFWIDAPSSLPIELIDMLMAGDSSTLSYLRFLRLFRLLRLLRLLKLGEYIAAVEIRFDINLTVLRILQMVCYLLFLAHILGCFWFYMAALVGIDDEIVTWVSVYDDGSAVHASPDVQYLYSVYWALTTLTTVGYGDITPTNNAERAFSLLALLVGALVFGYMLSSIGSLVAAIDRQAALSEEKMDEVKEYMRWRKLPRDLVLRMRRYYSYYYTRKTAFDEHAILGGLTPALRFEVVQHSLKETIGKIPLFATTLDPLFQLEVFPLFKPLSAAPREIIFHKGDLSHDLYFLLKGQVEVISGVDGRVLYRVRHGQHFGESALTGRRRPATHRAASSCEMFVISNDDLTELFNRRPREGRMIIDSVLREHRRKERLRNLSLRLLINKVGPSRKKDVAALRIQMLWNRHCDDIVYRASQTDTAAHEESLSEKMAHSVVGMTPSRDDGDGPPMTRGGSSISDMSKMSALESRLEKVDSLVERLEAVLRGQSTPKGKGLSSRPKIVAA